MKDTPIFICAKDRKSFLEQLLGKLITQGYGNIIIIDTGSTYPPMLDFLAQLPFRIVRVKPKSDAHLALWQFGIIESSGNAGRMFVYTDCDVVPDDNCPADWLERLAQLLELYPRFPKAGLGLRTDNLPDHYTRKQEVIEWEKQFMANAIEANVFDSAIDTTLALYRPGVAGNSAAIRTGGVYQARHLPWYSDSSNLTAEEKHYKTHMMPGVGHWR